MVRAPLGCASSPDNPKTYTQPLLENGATTSLEDGWFDSQNDLLMEKYFAFYQHFELCRFNLSYIVELTCWSFTSLWPSKSSELSLSRPAFWTFLSCRTNLMRLRQETEQSSWQSVTQQLGPTSLWQEEQQLSRAGCRCLKAMLGFWAPSAAVGTAISKHQRRVAWSGYRTRPTVKWEMNGFEQSLFWIGERQLQCRPSWKEPHFNPESCGEYTWHEAAGLHWDKIILFRSPDWDYF